MKKYEFTDETRTISGHVLHRIRALRDFANVKAGDLGGWIECENNLSHDGDCWIFDNACVFDQASVSGNARIADEAQVCDKATIEGDAEILDEACVNDNAHISEEAFIYGQAHIYGHADICGHTIISDNASIGGEVHIKGTTHIGKQRLLINAMKIPPDDDSTVMSRNAFPANQRGNRRIAKGGVSYARKTENSPPCSF